MLKVPTPLHPWGYLADSHLSYGPLCNFTKLVISEITFLTPMNSVLILYPSSIQHLSQPLLCCILEPLLCSSFFFRSSCCAASWSPCCAPLSSFAAPAVLHLGAPAVLLFLFSQPLLCCILEHLVCSSFWNPCCVPVDLTGVSLPAKFTSNKY